MSIKIELPIYHNVKGENKLIGMNWYRNVHYHIETPVKRYYHQLIISMLKRPRIKLKGKIKVKYSLYYKNVASDLMNIVSVLDKYLMDALQEAGIIENDNVEHYTNNEIEVIGKDEENPRLICEISEVVDDGKEIRMAR